MNKFYSIMWVAVLTLLTSAAFAQKLNYTFVSLEYTRFSTALNGFSDDFKGNGGALDLSVAVRPHMAVIASHSRGTADLSLSGASTDADIDSTSLGILIHAPISKRTDFVLSVSFFNGEAVINVDGSNFAREDANGGVSTIGFRTMKTDNLELNGCIRRTKIEKSSNVGLCLGAAYHVAGSTSVDLGYLFDNDTNAIKFAITKYF